MMTSLVYMKGEANRSMPPLDPTGEINSDRPAPVPQAPGRPKAQCADLARWKAIAARDTSQDGKFVYGVRSTGIFCRPSCPSRKPGQDGVVFFNETGMALRAGFRPCLRCRPLQRDAHSELVERLCRHIASQVEEPESLEALGSREGLSPFHLQRVFKRVTGLTPREYGDACRVARLKARLQAGQSVTEALYGAGYGSSSRLYERSSSRLGMTPATYGRRGLGACINYEVADCCLGKVLVAATASGLCSLQFGDSERCLVASLKGEYAAAKLLRNPKALAPCLQQIQAYLTGSRRNVDLPLDIRATAFQWRVWNHLKAIPEGAVQTYSEVAEALSRPRAARAVARACASNQVAVAIPCHRVIRADGGLGGYRWGLSRKERLLDSERARTSGKSA